MSIASINIENVHTNCCYLCDCANNNDFLVIQEHCFFYFEKHVIFDYLKDYDGQMVSVDHNDPISPLQRPRGYGGVDIVRKKKLAGIVRQLPDKTPKITAISIKVSGPKDICLIGAYFPSRGIKGCETDYQATLDQIRKIIEKYSPYHDIIICADFNTDLYNLAIPRTKKVFSTIQNYNLSLFNTPKAPTFRHQLTYN